jgi:hypothetical protein
VRGLAVHSVARDASRWMLRLDRHRAERLGPRIAHRLPTVVFRYTRGESLRAIAEDLSLFGAPEEAERALHVAASCIAAYLNHCTCAGPQIGRTCSCSGN